MAFILLLSMQEKRPRPGVLFWTDKATLLYRDTEAAMTAL